MPCMNRILYTLFLLISTKLASSHKYVMTLHIYDCLQAKLKSTGISLLVCLIFGLCKALIFNVDVLKVLSI